MDEIMMARSNQENIQMWHISYLLRLERKVGNLLFQSITFMSIVALSASTSDEVQIRGLAPAVDDTDTFPLDGVLKVEIYSLLNHW